MPDPLYLAGKHLVEQAEDRSGQQNDERPNYAPDHLPQVVNPGSLGINPRGLGFDFRPDFGDLSIDPGTLGVELGSQDAVAAGGYDCDR